MRKLPELRRKLSLRSPRPRAGPDGSGGFPEPPGESLNVISRYHLDTSVSWAGHGGCPELPELPGDPGSDPGSFRPYRERPGSAAAALSGQLRVRLRGLRPAWPPRIFCVLQVDGRSRARTALLAGGSEFLRLEHSFVLELERARVLSAAVLSRDGPEGRSRLLGHGSLGLQRIFQGDGRTQALALQLVPRGVLYSLLTLRPPQAAPAARVFGADLAALVAREGGAGMVPVIVHKCLREIERRGLKVVGLYRLCGSAAAKKELRDAFERDSAGVTLSESRCPDINVATLRRRLLSHLSLVAALRRWNRMGSQNLAVCFGPVLLPPRTCAGERPQRPPQEPAAPADFKRHLEVLHYLLRVWPGLGSDLGVGVRFGVGVGFGVGARLTLTDFDALIRDLERELGTRPDVGL
ncbi:hypothetical protein DUI87_35500 [Hirundo rustica rustica]|uniref:Rho-GAP domain-containing protein n=1 Tax=Hirundo rustica rustica TaxID=333673 RepID=A0A3M0IP26_HIRRU|nr:hypothetical protein DUI87_35500 [Hirundo rustica rustica]